MHSDILLNLLVATAIGALIGLERQWRQRLTGLTTHALVALGAAVFTSLPLLVDGDTSPSRIAAQVISGIGFLGAGVILRDGFNVRGLSTAATLWCSAAVGVLAGSGFALLATEVGALILATHLLLNPLGRWINRRALQENETEQYYRIELTCKACDEARIRALLLKGLSDQQLRLQRLESHALKDSDRVEVSATLLALERRDALLERLVGQLCLDPNVSAASWLAAPPPA